MGRKKSLIAALAVLILPAMLNAGMQKDGFELRRAVLTDSDLAAAMELNKLERKYYEANGWFNLTDAEKEEMKREKYPIGIYVMRRDAALGLDVLIEEAWALSAGAQIMLGIIYERGYERLKPHNKKILSFWEQMEGEGSPRAAFMLGKYYTTGAGVLADQEQARKYLQKAVDAGLEEQEARYYIGFTRYYDGETAAAEKIWAGLLEDGYAAAGEALGKSCMEKKEYAKAAAYFKKCLEQEPENGGSLYNMARINIEGLGIKKDPAAGFAYCKKAVEAGSGQALNMMYKLYRDGIGCDKDPEMAEQYRTAAKAAGY